MTTISSTAQQLLAEKYRDDERDEQDENSKARESTGSNESEAGENKDEPSVFDRHPDAWYRPNSRQHKYAVYTQDGDRKYYKTRHGAAERIVEEFE